MLWMALQLGVSNIDVYSALLTQTYVWWWTLPSFISTANKCTFDLLLTVLMKAEKLELLFRVIKKLLQKPVQIFFYMLIYHWLLVVFHALFHNKLSPSFLCFPIAVQSSSVWTCIQRKNIAKCNSLWLSYHHPFYLTHCNYILRE